MSSKTTEALVMMALSGWTYLLLEMEIGHGSRQLGGGYAYSIITGEQGEAPEATTERLILIWRDLNQGWRILGFHRTGHGDRGQGW